MTDFFNDLAEQVPDMKPADLSAALRLLFPELRPMYGRGVEVVTALPLRPPAMQRHVCQRLSRAA